MQNGHSAFDIERSMRCPQEQKRKATLQHVQPSPERHPSSKLDKTEAGRRRLDSQAKTLISSKDSLMFSYSLFCIWSICLSLLHIFSDFRRLVKFLPSGMISIRSWGISTADSAIPFWISSMLKVPSCHVFDACQSSHSVRKLKGDDTP